MTKGLKQMVAEATEPELPPVQVSGDAMRALAGKIREWSGWPNARLVIGKPEGSPFASCTHHDRTFTVNADALVLNPHRVLLTVTPFRLRQEGIMTGLMLHEAGHARFSHWLPRTEEEAALKPLLHGDGTVPTRAAVSLARLMEEPRIEGLMAQNEQPFGASGLAWTMRASAAHIVPPTPVSMDPNRQVMDVIKSWALRAGRQIALAERTNFTAKRWVYDFTQLLEGAVREHIKAQGSGTADSDTRSVMRLLQEMATCADHTGTTMIDAAKDVLELLFPETPAEEQPEVGEGCSGQPQEGDEEPEQGDSEDQEGEGDPEEGDDPAGPGEEPAEAEKDSEPESEDEGDGEVSDESDTEGNSEESSLDDGGGNEDAEQSELAQALADMEAQAKADVEDEAEDEANTEPASGAGVGAGDGKDRGWRQPNKDEREIQKGAEKFLRGLINPSESSKITLSDSPAATIDAAAFAAWRAGGMTSDPKFFRRTRRSVEMSPPVKIVILVDVSASMGLLQKPSGLLSWALAAAAYDLRNFAGRGQQVESCMIHWGSEARVIQKNGEMMPGIKEFACNEGTNVMHEALDLADEQIPGFLTPSERPEHRLLVQFTDWQLFGAPEARAKVHQALAAGVNMLSVVPGRFRHGGGWSGSDYESIISSAREQRGRCDLIKYNPAFPAQVWDTASTMLGQ